MALWLAQHAQRVAARLCSSQHQRKLLYRVAFHYFFFAAAIRAAHRRLIASVHPDKGGTEALAAQINAARDLLLADLAERDRPSAG